MLRPDNYRDSEFMLLRVNSGMNNYVLVFEPFRRMILLLKAVYCPPNIFPTAPSSIGNFSIT